MTQTELITAIGGTLSQIDEVLMEPAVQSQPARWQQLYALRKHLDDLQHDLVEVTIQSDDAQFETLTGKIKQAIDQLQKVINDVNKIDNIINTIAQISADLDEILKAAP
jgi:hypothetical protein